MEKAEPNRNQELSEGRAVCKVRYGVVLFLLVSVLFSGAALEKEAGALPYGNYREAMLKLSHPLGWISRFLRVDLFRQGISASAGRWLNGEKGELK